MSGRAFIRSGLAAAGLMLLLESCAHDTVRQSVDPREVSRVVNQVMTAQARTSPAEKIAALKELESFLLATDHKSEYMARALSQLADVYLQIEMQTYEKTYGRARITDQSQQAPPRPDHGRSIPLYQKVLAEYPDRPQNHFVYYQLARAYDNLGRYEMERKMLEQLVSRTPSGPYTTEALYRLGELAFDEGRFRTAADYYAKVLPRTTDRELRDFASYKQVWSVYLEEDAKATLDVGTAFIDGKRVKHGNALVLDSQAMPEPEWERVREIMTLLARVLYASGGVKALEASPLAHRDYTPEMYRKLGEVTAQMGTPRQELATYEAFVKRFADAAEVPDFINRMADLLTNDGDLAGSVKMRERLVRDYGPDSAWWKKQSAKTRHDREEDILQTTQRLARHYHAIAQKSRKPEDFEQTFTWYRLFLSRYKNSRDAPEMNFLLGEALFDAKDFDGAAQAYHDAAYGYAVNPRSAEAAYAAVYAREQQVEATDAASPAYAKGLVRLAAAFNELVNHFPQETRLPQAFERVVGLLFAGDAYGSLYDVTDNIIRNGPKVRDVHLLAWRMLGEAALKTGRLDRAEAALSQSLVYAQGNPEDTKEIKKLLAAVYVSRAATQDGVNGAHELLKAARMVETTDPLARTARLDAALALLKAGALEEAFAVSDEIARMFPGNAHVDPFAQALLRYGEESFQNGKPQQALAAIDAYRKRFGGMWVERDRAVGQLAARIHLDQNQIAEAFADLMAVWKSYKNEAVPDTLVDRLAALRYKMASGEIDRGDPAGLSGMEALAGEMPKVSIAPAALKIVVLESGEHFKDPARAVRAAQRLLASYPDSPEAEAVRQMQPDLYLAAGDRDGAARGFLELARTGSPDLAESRLLRAAELFDQEHDAADARDVWEQIATRFPAGDDRWVAAMSKVAVLETSGKAVEITATGLSVEQMSAVENRLLALLEPLRDGEQLGPDGRRIAGEILLRRADAERAVFDTVELVPPLKENLQAKQQAMKTATDLYAEAAAYRSRDVTLTATWRMGDMLESFGRALLSSPSPDTLTEEQARLYRDALEKRAAPYLEKAARMHERNLKRIREGELGEGAWASLKALGRLNPEWYDRPEKEAVPVHVP